MMSQKLSPFVRRGGIAAGRYLQVVEKIGSSIGGNEVDRNSSTKIGDRSEDAGIIIKERGERHERGGGCVRNIAPTLTIHPSHGPSGRLRDYTNRTAICCALHVLE